MNVKRIFLSFALLPLLMLPGCKLLTAAPTPGVPQFYSQAALVLNDFSGILSQSQTLFANAHSNCTPPVLPAVKPTCMVSDTDFANGERVFLQVAAAGDNVQSLVKAEAGQASITAAITALVQQIGTMPLAFGIKDPATQASFTALCTSMQTILQAAMTIVQTTTTTAVPAPTTATP